MPLTRSLMRRRSFSSAVSPGPRVPIPPPLAREGAEPRSHHPRQLIEHLRELNLEFSFERAGAVGEDVDDDLISIENDHA